MTTVKTTEAFSLKAVLFFVGTDNDILCLAADTKSGKTTYLIKLAINQLAKGNRVIFNSLDYTSDYIVRKICSLTDDSNILKAILEGYLEVTRIAYSYDSIINFRDSDLCFNADCILLDDFNARNTDCLSPLLRSNKLVVLTTVKARSEQLPNN